MSEQTMTPAEAAQLVEADRRERVARSADRIQDILSDLGCDLMAVPQVTPDGRIVAIVQIVAR